MKCFRCPMDTYTLELMQELGCDANIKCQYKTTKSNFCAFAYY